MLLAVPTLDGYMLNDITVLSEVLQIHVYAVLVGQLLK